MSGSNLAAKLNCDSIVDRIVLAVSANEGDFTSINHNDAGAGWSVGIRQWNQRYGELPHLIVAMFGADRHQFQAIFGEFADSMVTADGAANSEWLRHTDFESIAGFDLRMERALDYFQDLQVELARKFVRHAVHLAQQHAFRSELGWAEVADIVNQKGYTGCVRCLEQLARPTAEPSATGIDEELAVARLEDIAARPHGKARLERLRKAFSPHVVAKI